jgi:hypothetical protein
MDFTGHIFYQQSGHHIPPIPFWYNNIITPLICQSTQYPLFILESLKPMGEQLVRATAQGKPLILVLPPISIPNPAEVD